MRIPVWKLIPLATIVLSRLCHAKKSGGSIAAVNPIIAGKYNQGMNVLQREETVDNHSTRNDKTRMVLYWGQGDNGERKLSYYCDQAGISIVVVGFIVDYVGGPKKSPILNLSSNCDNVDNCVQTAREIEYCQSKGIKVLISVGGAVGPYHKQNWDPDLFAWWIWNKFLGGSDRRVKRPFGSVVMDGVDYDPESVDGVGYDRHIDTLRQLFKTQYPPQNYLITAAPQCPDLDYYSKNAAYNILHPAPRYDAYPDMVFIQFYNNYCSVSEHSTTKFNFDVWDKWSTERTKGRTKLFLGVLGKENHMDTGYVNFEKLATVLDDVRHKRNFGGVMVWDAGYAYENRLPILRGITYGEAIAMYLKQKIARRRRTSTALDTVSLDFKSDSMPVLIPIPKNDLALSFSTSSCKGQSMMLVESVSARSLAQSFGHSFDSANQFLELIGMNGDSYINPGSHVCLVASPEMNSITIGHIYNASTPENNDISDYYYQIQTD